MSSPGSALISAREAARRLASAGVSRRRVRVLLGCGLAGPALSAGGIHLYDADTVDALARRSVVTLEELGSLVFGLIGVTPFVARRYVDCLQPRREQLRGWAIGWPLSPLTAVWLQLLIERHGFVPFVGAVCGYITMGAELSSLAKGTTGAAGAAPASYELELYPAGVWFDELKNKRLSAPGGSPWLFLG